MSALVRVFCLVPCLFALLMVPVPAVGQQADFPSQVQKAFTLLELKPPAANTVEDHFADHQGVVPPEALLNYFREQKVKAELAVNLDVETLAGHDDSVAMVLVPYAWRHVKVVDQDIFDYTVSATKPMTIPQKAFRDFFEGKAIFLSQPEEPGDLGEDPTVALKSNKTIDFGRVWAGDIASATATFANTGDVPLQLYYEDGPFTETSPVWIESEESGVFDIHWKADVTSGPVRQNVVVNTNDPKQLEVLVPFQAEVAQALTQAPTATERKGGLLEGMWSIAEPATDNVRAVTFTAHPDLKLTTFEAESPHAGIRVEPAKAGDIDGSTFTFKIRIDPEKFPEGVSRHQIPMKTNLPGYEEFHYHVVVYQSGDPGKTEE